MKQVLSFLLSLVLMVGISTSALPLPQETPITMFLLLIGPISISRVSPKRGFLAVSAEVSSLRKRPSPAHK